MSDRGEEVGFQSPEVITIVHKHFGKAFTGDETSGARI